MNGIYDRYRLVVQEVERRNGCDQIIRTRNATPEDLHAKGYVREAEVRVLQAQVESARLALATYIGWTYEPEDYAESKMHDPAARKLADVEMILGADAAKDGPYITQELKIQQMRAATPGSHG